MSTAPYTENDVMIGDLSLHYQEWGDSDSPPVVMLHGFALSGHMYDEFAERLKDRYHLFALDQRGHGDSAWAEDGNYTREAFADDVEAFANALGLDRFILIGHSMGGMNAVSYTVQHPERVRALVLIDVGPEAASEGVENIVRFTRMPDEIDFDEFVERTHQYNPRRTIENIRDRLSHRLKQTESGKWTWKFDKRFRDPDSGIQLGSKSSNDENWNLFRRVSVPTLIVRGEESDILTQEVAERAVREMPNARLVVVKGAGHSVPGDNPDEFSEAVRNFLETVDNGNARAREPEPPLDTAVIGQVRSSRRRSGLFAFVAAGVAMALGAGALAWFWQRRRQRNKPAHRRAADRVPYTRDDIEAARQRAVNLATELSRTGQQRAMEISRRASDRETLNRAASQAIDLLDVVEQRMMDLDDTVRDRLSKARRQRRRKRIMRLQRDPGVVERALGGAIAAVDKVSEAESRGLGKAREKVGTWRR